MHNVAGGNHGHFSLFFDLLPYDCVTVDLLFSALWEHLRGYADGWGKFTTVVQDDGLCLDFMT